MFEGDEDGVEPKQSDVATPTITVKQIAAWLARNRTGKIAKLKEQRIEEVCEHIAKLGLAEDVDDERLHLEILRLAVLKPRWFSNTSFNPVKHFPGFAAVGVLKKTRKN
jgi:hypothetical protein